MSRLSTLVRRALNSFQSTRRETEIADEIHAHIEGLTERNIAVGMAPDDARNAALRVFGGIDQVKERTRDEHGFPWLNDSRRDLHYGVRQLRKSPGFSTVAILTLAISIGAATAIFSVVNSVLFRPLDYPESERLVVIHETYSPDMQDASVSWGAYYDWLDRTTCFSGIAASRYGAGNLTGGGEPQRLFTLEVTPNYFTIFGLQPSIGRAFRSDEGEPGKDHVMVISDRFWRKKFSGRSDVIEQKLQFNDQEFTIIGVLPPNHEFDTSASAFTPIVVAAEDRERRTASSSSPQVVVARLKPGISLKQAKSEMEGIAQATAMQYPKTHDSRGVKLSLLLDEIIATTGGYTMKGTRSLLFLLLGAVGFLLLIACVNLANLLLARATTRRKEVAMRTALGASRGRIIRQLLCESLLLAALGGSLGTFLAYGGVILLKPLTRSLPRADQISIDGPALAFSLCLVLITGIGFGLFPALQSPPKDLLEAIKDGNKANSGRRSHQIRSTLVVAEVALALILLTGAGLLIQSFVRLQRVDLGFQTAGVFADRFELPAKNYGTPQQQTVFVEQVLERISSLRNVSSAAFTSGMPIFGSLAAGFRIAGRSENPNASVPAAAYAAITPSYFKTLGIPLLRGRAFSPQDTANAPRVVSISASIAENFFPNHDAIGQRVSLANGPESWREIVGIVGDVKQWGPASDTIRSSPGYIYEPFAQNPTTTNLLLTIHTSSNAADLRVALRSVVETIDSTMPVTPMFRLADGVNESIARFRLSMAIFGFFAGTAVLLAVIGIYGVMAYTVSQRRHEIGVRLVLGAQRGDIFKLILGHGGKRVGLGLLIGLVGAIACSRLLRSLLFEIGDQDPTTFVSVCLLLGSVAFLACLLPARQAVESHPIDALRHE